MKQAPSQRTEPKRFIDYMTMEKKIKIFVVEDSDIYRELISSFIYTMDRAYMSPQQSNFEISSYSTGEHCVGELEEGPDIIILDYYLDGYKNHPECMDGLETLRKIKKLSPKTHVVMITSNRDIALANEFIVNGASDYVSKEPGVREKLQHSVARLIRIIRQERGEIPGSG